MKYIKINIVLLYHMILKYAMNKKTAHTVVFKLFQMILK